MPFDPDASAKYMSDLADAQAERWDRALRVHRVHREIASGKYVLDRDLPDHASESPVPMPCPVCTKVVHPRPAATLWIWPSHIYPRLNKLDNGVRCPQSYQQWVS